MTGVIVAVSLVLQGQLWVDWLAFIGSTPEGGSVAQFQIAIPLLIRLPAAVVLVAWGALTDRRWTVPVAATLALPVLWVSGFAICAALASTSLWPRPDASRLPGRNRPEAARTFRSMVRAMAGTLGPQPTGGATGHHRSTSRSRRMVIDREPPTNGPPTEHRGRSLRRTGQ